MAVSENKVRRSITLEKETYKLIQEVSKIENKTISILINELIEKEYRKNGKTN